MILLVLKHTQCTYIHTPGVHRIARTYKVLLGGRRTLFLSLYPFVQFLTMSPINLVFLLIKVCVRVRKAAVPKSQEKPKSYVLVSFASLCMISKIILQAEEQPSGVEWTLMAFSAAPAFSFLCTSILGTTGRGR